MLDVAVFSSRGEIDAILPQWRALYVQAAERNPFAHPDWLLAWARRYARPGSVRILAASAAGRLRGILPLYLHRQGPARIFRLLGTGIRPELVELPALTARPPDARAVVRSCVARVEGLPGWDLFELILGPGQGWLEPQLLAARGSAVLHKAVRACVVVDLPGDLEAWRRSLKPNVRKSIARARNQLDREAQGWRTTVATGEDAARRLAVLLRLHGARASMPGKVRHPAVFDDAPSTDFLHEAVARTGARDAVELHELCTRDATLAARLAIRGQDSVYLAWSGIDPGWYHVAVGTVLVAEIISRAILRGDVQANLSPGPDVAKLRWSERIEAHHEFLVVGPGARARAIAAAFLPARALADLRRESTRHTIAGPGS